MNLLNEKRVRFMKRRLVSIVTAICAAAPIAAVADTLTWNGGALGNFSTGPWTSDGSHTTPENGDTLVFVTGGSFANDIANLSVAGLSFASADAVTLTGAQIAVANGGSVSQSGAGAATISAPLFLGSASGDTVYFAAAASSSLTLSGALSGTADVFLNNGSADTGTINLRNDGSDYTGATTARRGIVNVYSNDAFGSTDGATTLSGAASNALKVYFQGVTMGEDFTVVANASNSPNNSPNYPVNFPASNTFNGTWSVSGNGYFYNLSGTTTFNGRVAFSTIHFLGGGGLVFNGEGSTFANDVIYGGTITYGAKCKYTGTLTVGRTFATGWINKAHRRNFGCENAMLYDETAPTALAFGRVSCTADMCGFDQTFSYISCASTYSSSVVTSADPSTVHLTLGGSDAVTCYAKFTGQVSLSFEGSRPMSLGNTASTSTGSLSLTNEAAVTLLDSFKWDGTLVSVADGSTLTVGGVSLPTETVVAIRDRSDSVRSVVSLAAGVDISVEALRINGAEMARGKTYGATGSGADVIDDDHFAGTGVLRVLAGQPLTLTWNGGSSGTFSSASWSGGSGSHTTPLYGDTLVFPEGGVFENDIVGLSVAGISVTSSDAVTITGLQIAVDNGGAISKSGTGVYTNSVPLLLGTAATPAVDIDVAANCSLVMNAAVSGPADIVYNNASTSTGTVDLRNDGSDYTGAMTVKYGLVNAYSDDSFGSAVGSTSFENGAAGQGKVVFCGITTAENFSISRKGDSNPQNAPYPIAFANGSINTFNGTWTDASGSTPGYYRFLGNLTVNFNGVVNISRPFFLCDDGSAIHFNGEGSEFAANYGAKRDYVYGGNLYYDKKCKFNGTVIAPSHGTKWVSNVQNRYFNCENALLYDENAPAELSFQRASCAADMCGYNQTFSAITCASDYSSSVVRSTDPSTVHLTLSGSSAATCYAKFTGQVSLSFEGSQPISLGNTANTSTGVLSLTNAAAVTLLDGFTWGGSSVEVADGSALTIGGSVAFPETLAVVISDRDAVTTSKIVLNANAEAETLTINGRTRSGGKAYGATGSGADVIDDAHFGGAGMLLVRKPSGTGTIIIVR